MTEYTSRQVAEMTGKTVQAISRYAQGHPGIGRKIGRDWLFTDADVKKIAALRRGPKRKPRKSKATQPEGGSDGTVTE